MSLIVCSLVTWVCQEFDELKSVKTLVVPMFVPGMEHTALLILEVDETHVTCHVMDSVQMSNGRWTWYNMAIWVSIVCMLSRI